MKELRSQNNQLICTPIKDAYAKTKKVGNLDILGSTVALAPLTVLVDGEIQCCNMCTDTIRKGTTVYVRAERYTSDWQKKQYESDEIKDKDGKLIKFIILPGNEVVLTAEELLEKALPDDTQVYTLGSSSPKSIGAGCPNSVCALH